MHLRMPVYRPTAGYMGHSSIALNGLSYPLCTMRSCSTLACALLVLWQNVQNSLWYAGFRTASGRS